MSTPETQFEYQKSLKNVKSYPFLHKYIPVDRLIVRPQAALVVRAVFKTADHAQPADFHLFLPGLDRRASFTRSANPLGSSLGGCLAMLSDVFDNADGMLARAKGMTSRYGAFLDLFLDRVADFAVLLGVTLGIYRTSGDPRVLLIGLLTLSLYFLGSGPLLPQEHLPGIAKNGEGAEAKNLAVFVILVFSLVGWPLGILIAVWLMAAVGRSSS